MKHKIKLFIVTLVCTMMLVSTYASSRENPIQFGKKESTQPEKHKSNGSSLRDSGTGIDPGDPEDGLLGDVSTPIQDPVWLLVALVLVYGVTITFRKKLQRKEA